MMKIGIQGEIGSFSEQAVSTFSERKKAPISKYTIKYLVNSKNVLEAVNKGIVDFGIFAIGNSQDGVVTESIQAMAAYRYYIIDLFQIRVRQNFFTLPNLAASDITETYSHQQALRQCREYLAAVIASQLCSQLYELELFEGNIHDLKNNLTRFMAITQYQG